eukprot:2245380-Rhodomonas_salina.2
MALLCLTFASSHPRFCQRTLCADLQCRPRSVSVVIPSPHRFRKHRRVSAIKMDERCLDNLLSQSFLSSLSYKGTFLGISAPEVNRAHFESWVASLLYNPTCLLRDVRYSPRHPATGSHVCYHTISENPGGIGSQSSRCATAIGAAPRYSAEIGAQ